jgi:Flp pilus assembly protein TadG
VLVAPLVLLLAVAVVQVGLALHVRSVLSLAASEGARAAALAGSDPSAGVRRARALAATGVAAGVVGDVTAERTVVDGLPVVTVRITADLPLVGLLGPEAMTVEGHALSEGS